MSQVVELKLESQLTDVCSQLRSNSLQVANLTDSLHHHQLNLRIDPDRWSIAECIVHLNLFTEVFIPLLRQACEQGRRDGLLDDGPYKMDVVGRLLKYALEPPSKWTSTTTTQFEPDIVEPIERVIPRFIELQSELMSLIESTAGLDLNRIKIASPISTRVRYNLYSCFLIIAAHQRRHLWQADLVRSSLLSNGNRR